MADRVMSIRQMGESSFGNEIPIGTEAKYVDVTTSTGTQALQTLLGENIGGGHNRKSVEHPREYNSKSRN